MGVQALHDRAIPEVRFVMETLELEIKRARQFSLLCGVGVEQAVDQEPQHVDQSMPWMDRLCAENVRPANRFAMQSTSPPVLFGDKRLTSHGIS